MDRDQFFRDKNIVRPPDMGDYSQRMFGWSFILVLTFLAIGLYFVWPRLFTMNEAYAPESAIHGNLAVFLEARDRCLEIVRTHSPGETIQPDAFIQALESLPAKGTDSPRIYLWRASGEFALDRGGWPEGWDRRNPPWKDRQSGVFVSPEKGIAHLVLFEPIPSTDLYLVVINPFLPVFTKERKTTP